MNYTVFYGYEWNWSFNVLESREGASFHLCLSHRPEPTYLSVEIFPVYREDRRDAEGTIADISVPLCVIQYPVCTTSAPFLHMSFKSIYNPTGSTRNSVQHVSCSLLNSGGEKLWWIWTGWQYGGWRGCVCLFVLVYQRASVYGLDESVLLHSSGLLEDCGPGLTTSTIAPTALP